MLHRQHGVVEDILVMGIGLLDAAGQVVGVLYGAVGEGDELDSLAALPLTLTLPPLPDYEG